MKTDRSYRGVQPIKVVPGRWHYATQRKIAIAALCGLPLGENLTSDQKKVTCASCQAILARYAERPERFAAIRTPESFVEARDRFAFKGILPRKALLAAIELAKTEGVRS